MFKIISGERPSRPPANDPIFQERGMTRDLWGLMEDCWVSDPAERPTSQYIVHQLPRKGKRHKIVGTLVSPSSFRASVRGDLDSHLSNPRVLRLLDIDASSLLFQGNQRDGVPWLKGHLAGLMSRVWRWLMHIYRT